MRHLISNNLRLANKFSNTDDLLTLNFANEIPNIYPPELVLKLTTESPAEQSYMDRAIRINKLEIHFMIKETFLILYS